MTECERIIEEGILPADFFKEETICDFFVCEKMKKVWAVEIDLLVQLDKVCRKYGLNYTIAGGTLLGKVRHNGFIPWDDDIDVFMPRKDYEKLLTNCSQEFSSPYELMIPCKGGYYFSHAMVRNANTSAVVEGFRYEEFNQGIFLDIFPLDNCLPETAELIWEKAKELVMILSTNMRRSLKYPTERDLNRMREYPYRDSREVFEELERIATQYNDHDTEYCAAATITPYPIHRLMWPWTIIMETEDVDFYGHNVKCTKHYDAALKIAYDNYMSFPPKEQRGTWHSFSDFDPDLDYKSKLKELREKDIIDNYKI